MTLLTKVDEASVAQHVAAAERNTAGEIVVVVADRSAEYGQQRAAFAMAATLLAAVLAYVLLPALPPVWIICGQAPLVVALWWVSGRGTWLRWLVPEPLRAAAVDARAKQVFIDHGVSETRLRSGVLLYLSELEHRVEILADRGIHERVGAQRWQDTVASIIDAIHAGQAARGVIGAVDAIGVCLAEHFPREADDVDELPNAPRRI